VSSSNIRILPKLLPRHPQDLKIQSNSEKRLSHKFHWHQHPNELFHSDIIIMSNQYEQLKAFTIVVADTGEVEAIKRLQPQDATTNPSLIYKAALLPEYADLVDDAVKYGKGDLSVVMVSGFVLSSE
jgi:hypothetical protein